MTIGASNRRMAIDHDCRIAIASWIVSGGVWWNAKKMPRILMSMLKNAHFISHRVKSVALISLSSTAFQKISFDQNHRSTVHWKISMNWPFCTKPFDIISIHRIFNLVANEVDLYFLKICGKMKVWLVLRQHSSSSRWMYSAKSGDLNVYFLSRKQIKSKSFSHFNTKLFISVGTTLQSFKKTNLHDFPHVFD